MLGCTGFGLFDPSTRVMVPELEKLGAYLPPSIEKISVPLSGDAGWDDLIELSTIATQLFKATYSVLKFILKKVKKILLEAHEDLSTAPQKRGVGALLTTSLQRTQLLVPTPPHRRRRTGRRSWARRRARGTTARFRIRTTRSPSSTPRSRSSRSR